MMRMARARLLGWLARKLDRIDVVRVEQLKASLQRCGNNVSIRWPVAIEGPERVVLEDDVSIASFVHIWGAAGVRIGARTMIGAHAAITSLTHEPDSAEMWKSLVQAPIDIGADVWVGTGALIMPGVSIGDRAVVGAGAVVLEDVPPDAVVVGVPARVVRIKGAKPPPTGGA